MIDDEGNETKTIYEAHLLQQNKKLRGVLETTRHLIHDECSHLEIGHTVMVEIDDALADA